MDLLWHRYIILEGVIPTDFLASNRNGSPGTQILMIDRIVRVCSAIYSHQIVVLFQLLLTRCVVLSLRKYTCSFKESKRGFVFFLPYIWAHIFFGLKFCLWIAIPPVISNDGLSVRRMDTFWIFHFQWHAFQESKVPFSSLVLKGFRWETLTVTNCSFLSLVIHKGDSIFPGKYQGGQEKVIVI